MPLKNIFVTLLVVLLLVNESICKRNTTKRIRNRAIKEILKTSTYVRQEKDIVEDGLLLVPELIKKYGYPCEIHKVVTPDGYILEIHRIPPRIKRPDPRPPLLFVPGLISSSADWTIEGPGRSLPLIVSDLGYDSWLINARGNRYSRHHVTLDPDKDSIKFFNFSYHEISTIDVPTVIDYMLNETKQEKAIYFGHSQGCTISYILLAARPEYNNKLKAVFSFAPSAFFHHAADIYHLLGIYKKQVQNFFENFNIYEVPHFDLQPMVANLVCGDRSSFQPFCTSGLFYIFGYSFSQLNATMLPVLAAHIPAGTSTKQGFHYLQAITSGKFRRYDYGPEGNTIQYGQKEPPEYVLETITAPVYLYYSKNDIVNSEKDVLFLFKKLQNAKKFLIDDPNFNHMDFLFAINAPTLVFERALNVLESL